MVNQLQFRRLLFLTLLLSLAFMGLGYRLVDLQVLRHDELAKEAQSNTQYTYRLEPRRGDILDCKGNLLATSTFVKTVCADPTLLNGYQAEVAAALAPWLQTNEMDLEKRLAVRTQKNKKGEIVPVQYVMLKHRVASDDWDKIQQTMAKLSFGVDEKKLTKKQKAFFDALRTKAVFTDPADDQLRNYPMGALAAHVIGFVGMADRTNNGVREQVVVGVDGIERRFDAKLRGVAGWRSSERDRHDQEIVALRAENVQPHDGLSVVLTIDSVIQHILETELAKGQEKFSPISISGIVIRPRTGEILAMATLPNFDPNSPGNFTEASLRNRTIEDIEEPGSTFKVATVAGALNDHIVKLTDRFDCENGHFLFAGKVLHDHKPYGILSVIDIIAKSSNIGAAKIGIEMGDERLDGYVRAFGFGEPTGIPLPGEQRGIVHPIKDWSKLTISRIPMGQGICVTSLQMAMALSAVANHGVLMQPLLVDRLVDTDGTVAVKYSPQPVRRVISEDADKDIIEALKAVVTGDGTAVGANMTNYTVAGKTGTAQKVDPQTHTYSQEKYFASFIGFFPADDPQVCIYVGLDEPRNQHNDPHQGGQTAAPIFHDIAVQVASYLNITPDKGVTPAGPPEMMQPVATDGPIKTASAEIR